MMKIAVEDRGKAVIIGIEGELAMKNISEFEKAFEKYFETGLEVIALDLQRMPYLDSFGISRIVKISRAFTGNDTKFVLINMNENIRQIFRMSTFDKIFNIMNREEFNDKYLPLDKLVDTHHPDHTHGRTGSDAAVKEKKVNQIEIEDINGKTLLFVDED